MNFFTPKTFRLKEFFQPSGTRALIVGKASAVHKDAFRKEVAEFLLAVVFEFEEAPVSTGDERLLVEKVENLNPFNENACTLTVIECHRQPGFVFSLLR